MKQKNEIETRLERYEGLRSRADRGSESDLVLLSAIDELKWVLQEG